MSRLVSDLHLLSQPVGLLLLARLSTGLRTLFTLANSLTGARKQEQGIITPAKKALSVKSHNASGAPVSRGQKSWPESMAR